MGWLGGIAGFFIGKAFGGGLGGIIGALIGSHMEDKKKGGQESQDFFSFFGGDGASSGRPTFGHDRQSAEILGAMAAMLAKLSKADGRVSEDEIDCCERIYRRYGLDREQREYAIRVFRAAKLDAHTIYDYADDFAQAVADIDSRMMFYDMLWDLACADGIVDRSEEQMLRGLCAHLRIPAGLFAQQARSRLRDWRDDDRSRSGSSSEGGLSEAYEILGVSPSATVDELKRAYREKAKRFHPDMLRSQGASDEIIEKANRQMARINAAWSEIRKARGIR